MAGGGKGANVFKANKEIFRSTPLLVWFSVIVMNMGALMFGYDVAMFGSLQTTPSWLNKFATTTIKGKKSLTSQQQSIINSTVWIGKFVGVVISPFSNEQFGYRVTMALACVFQLVGVLVEMLGPTWGAFSAGRTLLYCAVGMLENIVPLYVGKIVAPQSRGFFVGLWPVLLNVGSTWAGGAVQGIAKRTGPSGYLIATGQQFAPWFVIVVCLYFLPDSPRWLMQKDRPEAALKELGRVRSQKDADEGWLELEIAAIKEAIDAENAISSGSWIDCFRGTNLRRTTIVVMIFIANQWSGNQFITAYAPTLYTLLGRHDQAYEYTTIKSVLGLIGCLLSMILLDNFGRRPILIVGCVAQAICLLTVGGLGTKSHPSTNDLQAMIALIILFKFFCTGSVNTLCYVLGSEVPSLALRKKTMSIGTAVDVVAAFAVTYSSPYLLNAQYANLGAKIGFLWGGISAFFIFYGYFFVPELKNRSLEEIDELFDARLWAWQFKNYETHSLGAQFAHHTQRSEKEEEKANEEVVENESAPQGRTIEIA